MGENILTKEENFCSNFCFVERETPKTNDELFATKLEFNPFPHNKNFDETK